MNTENSRLSECRCWILKKEQGIWTWITNLKYHTSSQMLATLWRCHYLVLPSFTSSLIFCCTFISLLKYLKLCFYYFLNQNGMECKIIESMIIHHHQTISHHHHQTSPITIRPSVTITISHCHHQSPSDHQSPPPSVTVTICHHQSPSDTISPLVTVTIRPSVTIRPLVTIRHHQTISHHQTSHHQTVSHDQTIRA